MGFPVESSSSQSFGRGRPIQSRYLTNSSLLDFVEFPVRTSAEANETDFACWIFVGFRAAMNMCSHPDDQGTSCLDLRLCFVGGDGFEPPTLCCKAKALQRGCAARRHFPRSVGSFRLSLLGPSHPSSARVCGISVGLKEPNRRLAAPHLAAPISSRIIRCMPPTMRSYESSTLGF